VAGTWPAFHGGWPVRRGVRALGQVGVRPRALATLGRFRRWPMVGGRRGRGIPASVSAYRPALSPAWRSSTSRPTRPSSVTACGVRIRAILLVLGAGRQLMGNSLGGLPHIVYQTEGLSASVGGDWLAGVSCHQSVLYCRAVIAGLRLIRTRAAQFVRVSVAGTWPALHGGWPVRRGVVPLARLVSARVGLATLGRFCWWPMVGGRCGRGHLALWRAYAARSLARVRSFKQPPNPPIKRDRLRRVNRGDFTGFGCRSGSLWANRWAAIQHRIPNGRLAHQCRWRLRGGRLVPSIRVRVAAPLSLGTVRLRRGRRRV
jgi:hypothetical protein